MPLMDQYAAQDMFLYASLDPAEPPVSPNIRRQHPAVAELVKAIGSSMELYNVTLQHLRVKYIKTKHVGFCALRSDLVMALHDADVAVIYRQDPCHKFAWCLSACIRDRVVDSKRAKDLVASITTQQKETAVWGDLCMMLADPAASTTFVQSLYTQLKDLSAKYAVPRDSEDLRASSLLLTAGPLALGMIESRKFSQPPLPFEFISKFLPLVSLHMCEAVVVSEERKKGAPYKPSAVEGERGSLAPGILAMVQVSSFGKLSLWLIACRPMSLRASLCCATSSTGCGRATGTTCSRWALY